MKALKVLVIVFSVTVFSSVGMGAVLLDEGFETTAAGAMPAGWDVSGEGTLGVTGEKALSGSQSLKLTDASSWEVDPRFYLPVHHRHRR